MIGIDFNVLLGAVAGFLIAVLLELIRSFFRKRETENIRRLKLKETQKQEESEHIESKKQIAWIQLIALTAKDNSSYSVFEKLMNSLDTLLKISRLPAEDDITDGIGIANEREVFRGKIKASIEKDIYEMISEHDRYLVDKGVKYLLADTTFIGREDDCKIRIELDSRISRKHAAIRYQDGQYFVQDLGSTHGTFVNSIQVSNNGQELIDGDFIILGNTIMKFSISKPELSSSAETLLDTNYEEWLEEKQFEVGTKLLEKRETKE